MRVSSRARVSATAAGLPPELKALHIRRAGSTHPRVEEGGCLLLGTELNLSLHLQNLCSSAYLPPALRCCLWVQQMQALER